MLGSCQSDSYQINGFTHHLQEGDTICLTTGDLPEKLLGHAIVNEGKFHITGTTDTTLLCQLYLKRETPCAVSFFLEPGTITVELTPPPAQSKVSGTKLNNAWQQLNDSVRYLGSQLIHLAKTAGEFSENAHLSRLRAIDSLHRKMSDCILNTAKRNHHNALGKYIQENYKEPEFK